MIKTKLKARGKEVIALTIGFILVFSIIGYALVNSIANRQVNLNNAKYARVADPNTMDNYRKLLLSDENGSRYAGRIWSDKTVVDYKSTNNSLILDTETDGYAGPVGFNADFLHVFSALGSSQVVDQFTSKPIDVVLLLDISTSMTDYVNAQGNVVDTNDPLHQVVNETNTLISQLMGKDPAYKVHSDNRVAVVVYGGGVQQLLPIGHYETADGSNNYIKVSDVTKKDNTAYFPKLATNVKGVEKTTETMFADATYLQGALYEGMNMLATEKNTTYRDPITETRVPRTPTMITLTDGATNIVSATSTEPNGKGLTYNWYEPMTGVIPKSDDGNWADPGANPLYTDCNTGTGHGDDNKAPTERGSKENKEIEVQAISTRTISNLLLAGYYKNKIESNYKTDMIDFSIGYNVGGVRRIC